MCVEPQHTVEDKVRLSLHIEVVHADHRYLRHPWPRSRLLCNKLTFAIFSLQLTWSYLSIPGLSPKPAYSLLRFLITAHYYPDNVQVHGHGIGRTYFP